MGALITYDLSIEPQRDIRGRVIGITCTAIDITERKKAEIALRESEEKFRHLFEGSADGIFVMTDTFRDCNARVCEMWGCSREEVIGHTPAEFSPPLQPNGRPSEEAARDMIESALAGTSRFFRWKHRRRDGILIDTEISLKAVPLMGEMVLLATMRDVSEQVGREEILARDASENRDLAKLLNALLVMRSQSAIEALVVGHGKRITTSEIGFVGTVEPSTGHLVIPSMTHTGGDGKHFTTNQTVLRSFDGPWRKSLVDKIPYMSNESIREQLALGVSECGTPVRRILTVPVIRGGKLVGLFALVNARRDYTERDLDRVTRLASIYSHAIMRLRSDDRPGREAKAA